MFLTDREIVELAERGGISNAPPRLENPYSSASPFQPCSLDLTIGRIFVPGAEPTSAGGAQSPKTTQHVLEAGQTAIVETAEQLHLPSDIAGFGFPPAHVSANGILMTNPGHVDPGYKGSMSFTLVNMGRESFPLIHGQPICTILLFKLARNPERDYQSRAAAGDGKEGVLEPSEVQQVLNRLSPDFLDVKVRAERVAQEAVAKAQIRVSSWQVWVPLLAAAVTLGLGITTVILNVFVLQADLRRDMATLKTQLDIAPLSERVRAVENRSDLDQRLRGIDERLRALEGTR